MARTSEQGRLWHPRHWPTWVALGGFRLISLLPWGCLRVLSRVLGWLCYYLLPVRRRVVRINLRLCFPCLSERERRRLARAHYQSLALGLFETTAAWWRPAHRFPPYTLVGREHLGAALAAGRGALLLTAHFTTLELCARMFAVQAPFGCLYRDPNNPVVARAMRLQRERHTRIAIHFDDLRGLLRALKAGHAIWYAPDQGKRSSFSEILPFFGEPAVTNTATSRIAQMSGAPVVPYFGRRLEDGSYLLTILPALENFPTADPKADALRINRLIEEHIRLAPEQYFWVHKRFKRRGEGYPDAYA